MEKAFRKVSKEHARRIRKIWKAGCERAVQSVLEARRLDKDLLSSKWVERAMLGERTKAGLIAARENGRVGGRRRALNAEQQREAIAMVGNGKSAAHVAKLFGVHASTIGRIVNRME